VIAAAGRKARGVKPALSVSVAVEALVDGRDLLYPSPSLPMLQLEDPLERPVKVKSHEGYLLVERREGVA
jgi:hypothetical protein